MREGGRSEPMKIVINSCSCKLNSSIFDPGPVSGLRHSS